jgi:hypothetical protein
VGLIRRGLARQRDRPERLRVALPP